MIKDYINLDKEVAELNSKLEDQEEIFQVYKKIKIMSFVRLSLIKKIDKNDNSEQNLLKLRKIKAQFKGVTEVEQRFYDNIFD